MFDFRHGCARMCHSMRVRDALLPGYEVVTKPWPEPECQEVCEWQVSELRDWVRGLVFLRCGKIHDSRHAPYAANSCPDLERNLLCGHLLDGPRGRTLLGHRFLAAMWATRGLGGLADAEALSLHQRFTNAAEWLRCLDDSAYLMHHGFTPMARGVAKQALRSTRTWFDEGQAAGRTTLQIIQSQEERAEPAQRAIQQELLAALDRIQIDTHVETPESSCVR